MYKQYNLEVGIISIATLKHIEKGKRTLKPEKLKNKLYNLKKYL